MTLSNDLRVKIKSRENGRLHFCITISNGQHHLFIITPNVYFLAYVIMCSRMCVTLNNILKSLLYKKIKL